MLSRRVIVLASLGCTGAAALSRGKVYTSLARAHSNHAIIGVNGALAPIDKKHQSPLTPMMIALLGWSCSLRSEVVVVKAGKRRKAEEGERKGWARGAIFVP
jgi:hypothetical protein